jgi:hypothetical protein
MTGEQVDPISVRVSLYSGPSGPFVNVGASLRRNIFA